MLDYLVSKSKEITGVVFPKYVIKDLFYDKTHNVELILRMIKGFVEDDFGIGEWKFMKIDINGIDSFTDDTQEMLLSKMGGKISDKIPRDQERHNIQQSRINNSGITSEPIIVFMEDGKYDIIEGWHRTTQAIKKFGTYKQNAWVYIVN
jgi:hypothetical protein